MLAQAHLLQQNPQAFGSSRCSGWRRAAEGGEQAEVMRGTANSTPYATSIYSLSHIMSHTAASVVEPREPRKAFHTCVCLPFV